MSATNNRSPASFRRHHLAKQPPPAAVTEQGPTKSNTDHPALKMEGRIRSSARIVTTPKGSRETANQVRTADNEGVAIGDSNEAAVVDSDGWDGDG
ncbi:hypothetical protein A2U01_0015760 [Trifolium medium]|uniref:Uncharacterized protein n=1 Tax=Trifolium medium TaxID=97028 RepID=A0A392N5C8_9FABA|nr:hypothetical protein [Trifolium medium]